jgi:hypothetical protein
MNYMKRYTTICHVYSLHRLSGEMYFATLVFLIIFQVYALFIVYFASIDGDCVVLLFKTLAMH